MDAKGREFWERKRLNRGGAKAAKGRKGRGILDFFTGGNGGGQLEGFPSGALASHAAGDKWARRGGRALPAWDRAELGFDK